MDAKQVYEFLKPSLEQLSPEEKEKLCRLINEVPEAIEKKKPKTSLERKAYYKKLLMQHHFKN
ncbi:hypothetical protein SAMN05444483_10985 [Salegentibacter echinorum]|uniref:Uncharacterized protein n=1 Tax=Salegentibacter echinorum TaxID=1073325 RepID=A0A1M5J2B3_SALEC|nr:hypothetical protein [Salegentibacter echinorum]SHG34672.1 hypothetical protein SAMN05444483_10985 [Salegentibacter echinorum]